jgi:hypothetical protein
MTPVAPRAADVERSDARPATRETEPPHAAVEGVTTRAKGAQDRTVSAVKGAQDRTVSAVKGAQDRTVSAHPGVETQPERAPQREPKREPSNARAGKEPGNRGTGEHPPNPPEGGLPAGEVFVEESYVTERGRERKRLVPVDIDAVRQELSAPNAAQRELWLQVRAVMLNRAGGSVFEVWLSAIELVAVDREGCSCSLVPRRRRAGCRRDSAGSSRIAAMRAVAGSASPHRTSAWRSNTDRMHANNPQ